MATFSNFQKSQNFFPKNVFKFQKKPETLEILRTLTFSVEIYSDFATFNVCEKIREYLLKRKRSIFFSE